MPGAQDLRPVYLVTGCAGFIGSHLSERLVRDEDLVVGVDCLTDHYPRTGEGSKLWSPLAVSVIGGLLVSTLVTLVFVLVMYSIFEARVKSKVSR